MSKLRVLLTNNTLAARAGSELYVRDLATALLARGHTPIAYSTDLGEVAEELRLATIPAVDDLSKLAKPPDIIHGQHHMDTMTALLHFPGVPCVYFCHGWLPWEEAPPRFPRIRQYVAVDDTCRDRLLYEHAIASDQIEVLLNFVDLDRFHPRSSPLPPTPQRALVFSNAASHSTHFNAAQEACDRLGIALDVMGFGAGTACAQPEQMLEQYDIVFAKGRSALEAMAVGAAVIVHDAVGTGAMVTTENFAQLRRLNFGIRTLQTAISVEGLVRELSRYDPLDAAKVSQQIRNTGGRDAVVSQIIQIYETVLRQDAILGKPDAAAESHAISTYLRWLTPRMKQIYHYEGKLAQQAHAYEAQLAQTRLTGEQTAQTLALTQQHCRNLEAALEQTQAGLKQTQKQLQQTQEQLRITREQLQEIQGQLQHIDQSQAELEQLKAHLDWIETSKFWKLRHLYIRLKRRVMRTLGRKLDAGPAKMGEMPKP